tara:strand:+ start:410 stop:586 length:177 start_codon:yes stop_codon:yes gene_type:complete
MNGRNLIYGVKFPKKRSQRFKERTQVGNPSGTWVEKVMKKWSRIRMYRGYSRELSLVH